VGSYVYVLMFFVCLFEVGDLLGMMGKMGLGENGSFGVAF
jgi:hypothetical protein